MEQIESTDRIPVYDVKGNKLDEIRLPERIMPIPTRRGGFSAKGIYYKGSGIVYRNHLSDKEQMQMTDGEQVIGKTGLVYEKYLACYPPLVHKFGVFLFPHQPVFTDCEGGCGKKEKRLVDNQKDFAYSAIEEIVDVIPISIPEHCIYAYRLKNVKGGIEDTIALMEYVLTSDFNTAWDKSLWEDIYAYGYVRDVADWLVSDRPEHKLGTVYALLSSLYRADVSLYAQLLLQCFGEYRFDKYMILYYSAALVRRYCPELLMEEKPDITYFDIGIYERLLACLFSGRACCHLEKEEQYAWVRGYFDGVGKEHVERLRRKTEVGGEQKNGIC